MTVIIRVWNAFRLKDTVIIGKRGFGVFFHPSNLYWEIFLLLRARQRLQTPLTCSCASCGVFQLYTQWLEKETEVWLREDSFSFVWTVTYQNQTLSCPNQLLSFTFTDGFHVLLLVSHIILSFPVVSDESKLHQHVLYCPCRWRLSLKIIAIVGLSPTI